MPHRITFFNAVDVPHEVQEAVMVLLAPYDPDIREEDRDWTKVGA